MFGSAYDLFSQCLKNLERVQRFAEYLSDLAARTLWENYRILQHCWARIRWQSQPRGRGCHDWDGFLPAYVVNTTWSLV